jgi:signal transduction histidine kinase/ligand-binding sensor domain-containing protein/DNA-binding NarL/FixJ family response regulator
MGVIYKAESTRCKRAVALKLLILNCALVLVGVGISPAQESIGDFDVPIVMQDPWGITQDRYGAIWFIDLEKLYLYDGYSYRGIDPDGDSLDLRTAWTKIRLTGGRNGVLCITGYGDEVLLFFIDRNSSVQCRIPALTGADPSSTRITCVIEGANGFFWIGTEGGAVFALNPEDHSFKSHPKTLPAPIRALCEDREGHIWVGTGRGLFSIEASHIATAHPQPTILQRQLAEGDIAALACGKDGRLWVCVNDGLFAWVDPATRFVTFCKSIPAVESHLQVRSASVDSAGNIWIAATGSGLLRWSPSQELWEEHLVSKDDPSEPIGETVLATMVDRTGILWAVGLSFRGIARYVPEKGIFRSFVATKGLSSALHGTVVLAARIDHEGTLWVGTINGGIEYRPRGSSGFQLLRHHPGDPRSLSHNQTTCIYERRNGDLWIGTLDGINVLNRKSLTFTHIRRHQSGGAPVGSDTITAICEDTRGRIWIGHNAGLDEYNARTGKFRSIVRWPAESVGKEGTVAFLLEDRRENLWIATAGRGVLRFNLQREDTVWYREDPETAGSIPSNAVETLCEDSDGRLWLGTRAGLAEYDFRTDRFKLHRIFMFERRGSQLGNRKLVSTGVTSGIIPDGRGNLWLSTRAGGLVRLEVATEKQRAFTTDEGVVVGNGRRHAFFRSTDGTIYCGGDGGMTWFHPDSVRDSGIPPSIIISKLTVFGKPVPLSVHTVPDLRLDPQQNTLSFDFAALDYGAPDRNQFEYMLVGANPEWVRAERSRSVTFANLAPGDYLLRVRGSGREGVWSTKDGIARFTILSPWWRTAWAYSAYALLLLGILYAGYRLRIRQIHLQQEAEMGHFRAEHLAEVDRLKSRFFADISHEFRTPLTLILGPIRKWRERNREEELTKDMGMAERNANRLLSLVNELLDLSKIEAGAMLLRTQPVNIVPIVKGIAYSFESSAGLRKIDLEVAATADEIEVYVDRDKLEKVLSNLLSNALKFTPEGGKVGVTVRISRSSLTPYIGVRDEDSARGRPSEREEFVEIAIRDTGIGIPVENLRRIFDRFYQVDNSETRRFEGSGIGLALAKELVDLHHGEIHVQSEAGKGTEFTVRLPMGRNHLKDEEIALGSGDEQERTEGVIGTELDQGYEERIGQIQSNGPKSIILIVEDNADVRAYVREQLIAYQVLESSNGIEGIETAREVIPDLIISDVMMPGKDGYELCRILKTDEKTSHIPIILLTAKAASEHKIQGLETGADDYLTKPFDAKELLTRIRNLVEIRQQLRKKFSTATVLKPGEVAVPSINDALLKRIMGVVEAKMADERFGVEELARLVGLGRRQLERKLLGLTNLSPGEFIRYMRLQRAHELLKKNTGSVAEIAFRVGFSSPSHFSSSFHQQFGFPPSEVERQVM